MTREHNRLVTDDHSTKQWFGIYTIEEFYSIHERFVQIDSKLDDLYPNELRPRKGYLFTYFVNDLKQCVESSQLSTTSSTTNNNNNNNVDNNQGTIDLQDNQICNSISEYLKRAYESLGKNLYIDVLFNDINSQNYFEVYSEFNLKRIQAQLDKLRADLGELNGRKGKLLSQIGARVHPAQRRLLGANDTDEDRLNDARRKIRIILDTYGAEDRLISQLFQTYAEYYNNLLKPIVDSIELAQANLVKYEKKLANQEKTNKYITSKSAVEALDQLKQQVVKSRQDIYELSNDIDNYCIMHKHALIELYTQTLEKINADKARFIQPKSNKFQLFFHSLVKDRIER